MIPDMNSPSGIDIYPQPPAAVRVKRALGILALTAVLAGTLAPRIGFLGRFGVYLQTLAMSFSFFLLLVPGTNETLSRLPVDHPLASGIDSPVVRSALTGLLILFLIGTAYQMFMLARQRRG